MDKTTYINKLFELLDGFTFHQDAVPEIIAILKNKNPAKFLEVFEKRISELKKYHYRVTEIFTKKKFENLTHAKDLYSMHVVSPGLNVRILYAYDGDEIILCCFNEIGGKSNTDYTPHIPKAHARFNEIKKSK